jgi:predicted transcriptional regulator of viral defense system
MSTKVKRDQSHKDAILEYFKEMKIIRIRDLLARGIDPGALRRMEKQGLVVKVARGMYVEAKTRIDERQRLALVAKKAPQAVLCLLTALRFHEIGTQAPREIWIAINRTAKPPRISHPQLRVFKFSGAALVSGIETHRIAGVEVRVYNAAKTVADCFKYRGKIGGNIAAEALKDALRQRKCTMDDLWRYARICRVSRIMQPYLEAVA